MNKNICGPAVSVLMSVYNGEDYLVSAVDSVLGQTYRDFEFIIIDDASTDSTADILNMFAKKDNRIRFIKNKYNIGLTKSLNNGLKLARGRYIARMDADDISLPQRFEKQIDFLEQNRNVLLCGAYFDSIPSSCKKKSDIRHLPPEEVYVNLFFENCIPHPSITMRREVFEKYNLFYDESLRYTQDYEYWTRIAEVGDIVKYPEVLLEYRFHEKRASAIHEKEQFSIYSNTKIKQVEKLIGRELKSREAMIHKMLIEGGGLANFFSEISDWCILLVNANIKYGKYNNKIFMEKLAFYWNKRFIGLQKIPISIFLLYFRLPFREYLPINIFGIIKKYFYTIVKNILKKVVA